LDNSKLQTSWLSAGCVPTYARDWRSRFNDRSSGRDNAGEHLTEIWYWDSYQGQRSAATERGIFDGPDPAIDSGFSFGSGLDAVVLIRHVELLEAPAKYAFEEGLSLTHIRYCEIEVGWLHGFDVFSKVGRAAGVPFEA